LNDTFGSFDLIITLPEKISFGKAILSLSLEIDGILYETKHQFYVRKFCKPTFKLETKVLTGDTYFYGEEAIVKASCSYYSGVPLINSSILWTIISYPLSFIPPGLSKYSFSNFQENIEINDSNINQKILCRTDNDGEHFVKLKFQGQPNPILPLSISCIAEVTDSNNMILSSSTSLNIHPCDYYVGIYTVESKEVKLNDPFHIDFVVSDHNGNLSAGVPILIHIREHSNSSTKESLSTRIDERKFISVSNPMRFTILCTDSSVINYEVLIIVVDSKSRKNIIKLSFPVSRIAEKNKIKKKIQFC